MKLEITNNFKMQMLYRTILKIKSELKWMKQKKKLLWFSFLSTEETKISKFEMAVTFLTEDTREEVFLKN